VNKQEALQGKGEEVCIEGPFAGSTLVVQSCNL